MSKQEFDVGDKIIYKHAGQRLKGRVMEKTLVGPDYSGYVYSIIVEGYIGKHVCGAHELERDQDELNEAYKRAMSIL